MPKLTCGPNVDESKLSQHTRDVVDHVLEAAGCPGATASSFTRTPRHFAEILHTNLLRTGAKPQRFVYTHHCEDCREDVKNGAAPTSDTCAGRCQPLPTCQVIDVWEASARLTAENTIVAMTDKVVELGPEHCSRHCSDPALMQVLDLMDSSLGKFRDSVIRMATAVHGVSKCLVENGVVHIEIPQPQ